jgi:transcriptional antiterminator RfaH
MKLVKKEKNKTIWVLIYTKAKEEKKANENLQKQGFKTFLPLIATTNKNGEFSSLEPVFPRYLFTQINFEFNNWTAIKSSYGVSNIVMFSEKFTSIPDNIIQAIEHRLNEEGVFKEDVSIVDLKKAIKFPSKRGVSQV